MQGVSSVISFKGKHISEDIILQSIRWYLAYPLNYRQIEEMIAERGIKIDHSTINRWVLTICTSTRKSFS